MGMPCEVNSILKLKRSQGFPEQLKIGIKHETSKDGYRIIPIDVPIPLVDEDWVAHADVVIRKLTWENNKTTIKFEIQRLYSQPLSVK